MSRERKSSCVTAVAALLFGVVQVQAQVITDIVSSVADYEPRLEQNSTSEPFFLNNIDDLSSQGSTLGAGNIDIPSDATILRVGGQSRHKMNAAMFFPLPESSIVDSINSAHFKITQVGISGTPITNADLWAVGVYSDIAVSNDFDDPQVNPTIANGTDINTGLAGLLYLDADVETTTAGLNTSVPRQKIAENFLIVTDALSSGTALRETDAAADASLASYLNSLYASTTIGPDTWLVLRLNPDAVPSNATNQYRFASANDAVNVQPTLTLNYNEVPEPGSFAVLASLAVIGAARRRRCPQA